MLRFIGAALALMSAAMLGYAAGMDITAPETWLITLTHPQPPSTVRHWVVAGFGTFFGAYTMFVYTPWMVRQWIHGG